jgi:alpha-1,6-mannosyltransferase
MDRVMSATARVDPDFRSEPSTTDAHRTARFGNPPRRPLVIGLLGSLMLLVGGFGAGGVLVRDPAHDELRDRLLALRARARHRGDPHVRRRRAAAVGLDHVGDATSSRTGSAAGPSSPTRWCGSRRCCLAPPLFTRDIFSYLAQGALPLHGFDPYAVGPDAMPGILTDNVHYFWQDTPAPYGPLFIIIAKTVAWLVGNNIIAGVLLMRLALLPGSRCWSGRCPSSPAASAAACRWRCGSRSPTP